MKFAEKFFVVFGLIGISMRLLNVGGGSLFVVLALLCLALLYLFFGFIFYNSIMIASAFKRVSYAGVSTGSMIFACVAGLLHSVLLVAFIFYIQNWQGGAVLLFSSL